MLRILFVVLLFVTLASSALASVSYLEGSYNPALLPLPGALYDQWFTELVIWSDNPSVTGFLVSVQINGHTIRREVNLIPGESGAIAIFVGTPQQVKLLGIQELRSAVGAALK